MVVTVLSSTQGTTNVEGSSCEKLIPSDRLGGVKDEVYNEGTHFAVCGGHFTLRPGFLNTIIQIPWFETPIIYDIRAKPRNVASLTGTKGSSN
jgi:prohibitin 2